MNIEINYKDGCIHLNNKSEYPFIVVASGFEDIAVLPGEQYQSGYNPKELKISIRADDPVEICQHRADALNSAFESENGVNSQDEASGD